MAWSCPLCLSPLVRQISSYRCENGHQFDRAREGYLNLLPVQYKRSLMPGDNAEMIQARRHFLDEGHYSPLREAITAHLQHIEPRDILDIGCGEGYYTSRFAKIARGDTLGLDISKVAIRAAAKRYSDVDFCVASSQRLPLAAASLDTVIRIFAPCDAAELQRVVKPSGYIITATPGPRHLMALKELIYQQVKLHESDAEQLTGFTLVHTDHVAWDMALTGSQAASLLQMTPFAWRATPEISSSLKNRMVFHCQADFMIRVWQLQP